MHIEPGVVNGAKIGLSYLTGAAALGIGLKFIIKRVINEPSVLVTAVRCLITTIFVFSFFEVLPQYPLGVSEVHFIFGATLSLSLALEQQLLVWLQIYLCSDFC